MRLEREEAALLEKSVKVKEYEAEVAAAMRKLTAARGELASPAKPKPFVAKPFREVGVNIEDPTSSFESTGDAGDAQFQI